MFALTPLAHTLHGRFEQQVALRPKATAVECDGVWLTYRELNQEANRLARKLAEEGVGTDELVLIDMDRSCDLIVGLLAVLKAGGAFLLLDDAPRGAGRAAWIRETGAQVILTDFSGGFEASGLRSIGVYEASGTDQNLGIPVREEHWACVAGNLGWTHRSVLQRLDWAREVLALDAGERVLSCVPLEGNAAIEALLPLITGAALVLASARELQNPERMDILVKRADCRTLRVPRRLAEIA